jgi:steroid delta-isomerase-like uncharacterized protein
MSQENTNKALARRAIEEVWNRGNYAVLPELVANDILIHAAPDDIHGHEGIRRFYDALRHAFPDLHFTIEDQIADGDRIATRWSARGTHQGTFQGIPATGKPVRLTGIDIDRFVAGKVVECWPEANELGLLHQLGVLSEPAPAGV